MPTIDVSQTNVKKEGTALNIEPTKEPKNGIEISLGASIVKKEGSIIDQAPVPEIKQSPTVTLEPVKEQKDA